MKEQDDTSFVGVPVLGDNDFNGKPMSAAKIARGLGIVDRNGSAVAVGTYILDDSTKSIHRITSMHIYEVKDAPGKVRIQFNAEIPGSLDVIRLPVIDGVMRGIARSYSIVEFAGRKEQ